VTVDREGDGWDVELEGYSSRSSAQRRCDAIHQHHGWDCFVERHD
jgi:hypothetical protein